MSNPEKCPVPHEKPKSWTSSLSGIFWASPGPEQCPVTPSLNLSESACPVSPESRDKWLRSNVKIAIEEPECSSDKLPSQPVYQTNVDLPEDRQILLIPRTGENQNWVYPSQKQFYEAMKRKNWNPEAQDMKTVVPIHNVVNERVWRLIQWWEEGQGGDKCGGIQLTSFKGESKKLTPRARWKVMMGYERPFDRHDWVVNRCGQEIEYVIDFYAGNGGKNDAASFFLDVRPKLNSVEGVRLRLVKALGL